MPRSVGLSLPLLAWPAVVFGLPAADEPAMSLAGLLAQLKPARINWTWLSIAVSLLLVAWGITLYTHRINRRLDRALAASREAEQALRESEERHRLLADNASDVIWIVDLQGRCTYVSPSVEKLRGYSVAEVLGQSLDEALTPESAAIARAALAKALATVEQGLPFPKFRGELEQPCKDGSTVWTEVTTSGMHNAAGEFIGILGVSRDIGERRRIEMQIRHLARHDPLTELPNRALFVDRLQQAVAMAKRNRQQLAVLFIDLDRFKPVNDTYGHAVGDRLLQEVARRMLAVVRQSDTVARLGGDEFVVLLQEVASAASARRVADKLHAALRQPFVINGHPLQISSCIGLALYPEHGGDALELTKNADSAMYQAKHAGRDRVCLFGAAPQEE